MSRDELLVVVDRQAGQLAEQAGQLAARDRQIAGMAGQLSELLEANEALAAKLARLEHLLSRNSGNSSSPPSRDDGPGKPPPPEKPKRGSGPARARGKDSQLNYSCPSGRVGSSSGAAVTVASPSAADAPVRPTPVPPRRKQAPPNAFANPAISAIAQH